MWVLAQIGRLTPLLDNKSIFELINCNKISAPIFSPPKVCVANLAVSMHRDGPCWLRKHIKDIPVVDAPVQAKVERAEVATFPHHFHHRLVVELRDVSQIQDAQVTQLQEATHKTVFRVWKNDAEQSRRGADQSRQRAKYFNPTSKKSERNS